MGRTNASVSGRYYGNLRKNHKVLALASRHGMVLNNAKNVPRRNDKSEMSEQDVIDLMKGMFRTLSGKGKKEVLTTCLNL